MIIENLRSALHDVRTHPLLFVPALAQALANLLVGLLFFLAGLVIVLRITGIAPGTPLDAALLTASLSGAAIKAGIIIFLLSILAFIFMNAWFQTGLYALVKKAVAGKKPTLRDFLKGTKEHYTTFLTYSLFTAAGWLLIATPLLLGFVLMRVTPLASLLLVFGIIFLLVAGLLWWLALLYAPPLLFAAPDGWTLLKSTIRYALARPLLILKTAGVYILLGLAVAGLFFFFQLLFGKHALLDLFQALVQMALSVLLTAFLFRAQKASG